MLKLSDTIYGGTRAGDVCKLNLNSSACFTKCVLRRTIVRTLESSVRIAFEEEKVVTEVEDRRSIKSEGVHLSE
jgi:hypothetical protein